MTSKFLSHVRTRLLNITWSNLRFNVWKPFVTMATNLPSCFSIQFLEQLLKFLVNYTLLKYVKCQRSYGFLITKELIFGFQTLDLKDHSLLGLLKGEFRIQHKLGSNERAWNFQMNSHHWSSYANWFLRYRGSMSQTWTSPFPWFQTSFSFRLRLHKQFVGFSIWCLGQFQVWQKFTQEMKKGLKCFVTAGCIFT